MKTAQSNQPRLRKAALEALFNLVFDVFDILVKEDPNIPTESNMSDHKLLTQMTHDTNWKYPAWQVTTLSSFIQCIMPDQDNIPVINASEKIIQSYGNQLASVGWDELIKVVERISISQDKKLLTAGFKVLKLIM